MDAMLEPVLRAALDRAAVQPGEAALDVGCGCGASTLALADAVGPAGRVTGLDVSAPMLDLARRRGAGRANVTWVVADAAVHPVEPASADLLFSRFGVMFFGQPEVAFANLRRALRPTGRLVFACWRAFADNPWMRVPLHAAYAHVPPLPRPGPEDPGPFAFADQDRVRRILSQAGFREPRCTPVDLTLDLAGGEGLDTAVQHAIGFGPAARAMQDQPEAARAAATAAIRDALAPHVVDDRVPMPAAIWLVEGTPA